jgi:hypothetical protein
LATKASSQSTKQTFATKARKATRRRKPEGMCRQRRSGILRWLNRRVRGWGREAYRTSTTKTLKHTNSTLLHLCKPSLKTA